MFKHILRVMYGEHRRLAALYDGMPRVSDIIRQRRLQFAGHLARTTKVDIDEGPADPLRTGQLGIYLLTWPVPARIRRRGGQQWTYHDKILAEMQRKDLVGVIRSTPLTQMWSDMQDKQRWADIVKDYDPSTVGPIKYKKHGRHS
eukprot:jgi/Mesvir1/28320/Mv04839-RA.1